MNVDNLGKVLANELARNKKQTMVLGGVTLVALYFWAPLLMEMLGGKGEPANATPIAAVEVLPNGTEVPLPSADQDTDTGAANLSWKDLVEWMNTDPRMRPATYSADQRDPFQHPAQAAVASHPEPSEAEQELVAEPQSVAEQASAKPEETEIREPRVTPQNLGLQLASTILGGQTRLARINGKSYHEDEWVHVEVSNQPHVSSRSDGAEAVPGDRAPQYVSFHLTTIQRNYVVLQRNGQEFQLSIQQPKLPDSGKIEIYPVSLMP